MGLRARGEPLAAGDRVIVAVDRSEAGRVVGTHPIGTLSRLVAVREAPDGGQYLDVAGERLVAIEAAESPPTAAACRPVETGAGCVDATVVPEVEGALRTYMAALAEAGHGGDVAVTLSRDPVRASHEVASMLRISWPEIQELLEAGGAGDRLRRSLQLLRRETTLLRALLGGKGAM
jgi:hypothetical protein